MNLDVPALRWAKAENLERLLRSLGAPLPERAIDAGIYHRRLVRAAWLAMDHDKRQAAAEEQRMKDEEERRAVAAKIADALGETGDRPRAQIVRIVALMGAEWTREVFEAAINLHDLGDAVASAEVRAIVLNCGTPRSRGGAFFAWARECARSEMARGVCAITRREFFRAFTDRPKKPRALPPKPAAKAPIAIMESPVEAPPDPYHVMHRTRGGKGSVGRLHKRKAPEPVVEYVATRRRSG